MRERLALTEPNSGAHYYLDLMAHVAQAHPLSEQAREAPDQLRRS
jgi:hypothetical protein